MEKSKKRYLRLILCAVMVVLCTTSALADNPSENIPVEPLNERNFYKENNGSWYEMVFGQYIDIYKARSPYTFAFNWSFNNQDSTEFYFRPYMTYTGNFSMTFKELEGYIQYQMMDFDGYFRLATTDDPSDSDYEWIDVNENSVTYDFDHSTSSNSATNTFTYSYNFVFRLNDDIEYNKYPYLQIYYPLARNHIEDSYIEFYYMSTNFSSMVYDLTGDAYQDAVLGQFSLLAQQLKDHYDEVSAEIRQGVADILASNANTFEKLQQIYQFLNSFGNVLQTEADREDQETQRRANAGQEQAASVFNATKFTTGLNSLFSGINYTGTYFNFTFPAAHDVPYLGDLWDSETIPLKEWIDNLPPQVLMAARVVFWLGVILSVFWHFQNLLDIIGGVDKQ